MVDEHKTSTDVENEPLVSYQVIIENVLESDDYVITFRVSLPSGTDRLFVATLNFGWVDLHVKERITMCWQIVEDSVKEWVNSKGLEGMVYDPKTNTVNRSSSSYSGWH